MDSGAKWPKVSIDGNIIGVIKAVLLLGIIFWIVMPSLPFPSGVGLDSSWVFGVNMGHSEKLIFGRDIIFTYGPAIRIHWARMKLLHPAVTAHR